MGHKKKNKKKDDELFPDTAPKKEPTKRVEKPKTESVEKPVEKPKTQKVEKPVEKPKTQKVKTVALDEKPAKTAETAPTSKQTKLIAAGVGVLAIVGVAVLLSSLLSTPDATPRLEHKPLAIEKVKPLPVTPLTAGPKAPVITPNQTKAQPLKPIAAPTAVAAQKPPAPKSDAKALKDLATRSANHGAIARVLELFESVRKVDFRGDNQLLNDYQAKQRREKELIDQIRGLGPVALDALKDMIGSLDDDGYKIFLAKALGGWNSPDALKATADLLASCHDIAVQTTLVRFLPDGPDATAMIATDFGNEPNPNVRAMLLREYARRTDPAGAPNDPNSTLPDSVRALFQQAALNDPDPNVRAEAVSIIGRRADPRDMDLMQQIASGEANLQIRQSAIVAYATTGQAQALPFLDQLATAQDNSLEVRASAVLAIARVGNADAIQMLDQIASTDPREEIRSRAQGFANGLRSRQNAAKEQRPIDATPVPFVPPRR